MLVVGARREYRVVGVKIKLLVYLTLSLAEGILF